MKVSWPILVFMASVCFIGCKTRRSFEGFKSRQILDLPKFSSEPVRQIRTKLFILHRGQSQDSKKKGFGLVPVFPLKNVKQLLQDLTYKDTSLGNRSLTSPARFRTLPQKNESLNDLTTKKMEQDWLEDFTRDIGLEAVYIEKESEVFFPPGSSKVALLLPKEEAISDGKSIQTEMGKATYTRGKSIGDVEIGILSRDSGLKRQVQGFQRYELGFDAERIKQSWGEDIGDHASVILKDKSFDPVAEVMIDQEPFSVSQIFRDASGERDMAVLYAYDYEYGVIVPRLMYNSTSNGGWRVAPYIYSDDGSYSKGLNWHYTQETKPVKELALLMDQVNSRGFHSSKNAKEIFKHFYDDVTKDLESYTYRAEMKLSRPSFLKHITDCSVNRCFRNHEIIPEGTSASEFIENLDFSAKDMRSFVPDFRKSPSSDYKLFHPLLGNNVNVEVFESIVEGRTVEWHMASSPDGKVWIDRINYKDAEISSYGVYSEVLDSGVLTSKPFTYKEHTKILREGAEFLPVDETYVDVTPILDRLYPIKEYRKHRKKFR